MKHVLILFIVILLLSGCIVQEAINTSPGPESDQSSIIVVNPENTGENDTSKEDDVEENVNLVDINDDVNITDLAESQSKTESDQMLPQAEIETGLEDCGDGQSPAGDAAVSASCIVESYNNGLPNTINLNLKYDKYPLSYSYLVVLGSDINIRKGPSTESEVARKALIFEKLNLSDKVKGEYLEKYDSAMWYRVFWKEGDEVKYGYVHQILGDPRSFQFVEMEEAINLLKNEVENNTTGFISNYKNRNGLPPAYGGKNYDKLGNLRQQSAPAYISREDEEEFVYLADGTIVSILDENDKFYRITTSSFEGEYWVPKKYVSFRNSLEELTKVVVVDRSNQNQGAFEYMDGQWHLVSYTLATTGANEQYKFETPLGYYMAIETKPQFLYLDDITGEIAGYAPFATRFTGGAYIHGIPVDFKMENGKRIDPGHKEYLFTLGTVPRSHKCVRNYTSHAEFIYNWIEIGKSAVVVIE